MTMSDNDVVEVSDKTLRDTIKRMEEIVKLEKKILELQIDDAASNGEPKNHCCANCGKTEAADVKFMSCTTCNLVRYCGDECEKKHRPKHEGECKKRAAALRDEILFKQPESSHLGDCPICFLPLPIDGTQTFFKSCCGQTLCNACLQIGMVAETNQRKKHRCPFCRCPNPKSEEQARKKLIERAEAKDPGALRLLAIDYADKGNGELMVETMVRAAAAGDAVANVNLSDLYAVLNDTTKQIFHMEEAAIRGVPEARFRLATDEMSNNRFSRAVRHAIIGAHIGDDGCLQLLKDCYKDGHVSKEDFAAALRAHQAAVDATKSPQREKVKSLNL